MTSRCSGLWADTQCSRQAFADSGDCTQPVFTLLAKNVSQRPRNMPHALCRLPVCLHAKRVRALCFEKIRNFFQPARDFHVQHVGCLPSVLS